MRKLSTNRGLSLACMLFLAPFGIAPSWAQPGAATLKVFVLAGQSNMEGWGQLGKLASEPGTLKWMVQREVLKDSFPSLVDGNKKWLILDNSGNFKVRDDVWMYYKRGDADVVVKGGLTAGMGGNKDHIGPEFGFGHVMGEYYPAQVLVIKVARGGKSLWKDFLAPREGKYAPPAKDGDPGYWYKRILDDVKYVMANLRVVYPAYAGEKAELAGFGWHQGWNDGETEAYAKAYEGHMVNFAKEIRQDLGYPNLPFVIAVSGFNGYKTTGLDTWQARIANIIVPGQFAAAAKTPYAAAVDTRAFWQPPSESPDDNTVYHWNLNAVTYSMIGYGMGEAMKKLIKAAPVSVRNGVAPRTGGPAEMQGAAPFSILGDSRGGTLLDLRHPGPSEVRVSDLSGRQWARHTAQGPSRWHLPNQTWPRGIYRVTVRAGGKDYSRALPL